MNYKTNRLNHDFQIVHFLAGSCHTPDGAYALLCDLREDRENAIKMFEASRLRERARRLRAQERLRDADEATRCEAEADLAELAALAETTRKNYEGAVAELDTIVKCMRELEPRRRFKHLPDAQAHEAAQAEEWKLELIERAVNCLLTTGTIATDQFATMRLHPAFATEIWPAIDEARRLLLGPGGPAEVVRRIAAKREELPERVD